MDKPITDSGFKNHTTNIPENLGQPWPLDVKPVESESNFDLDKALSLVDRDRMDILDTLIRVTVEEEQMLVSDALGVMRSWEHLVRNQLSQATGPQGNCSVLRQSLMIFEVIS